MAGKKSSPSVPKSKTTISLSAPEVYRLDILAAHRTLERGKKVTRSDVVSELIRPHLRSIVVSMRSGQVAEPEAEA